MPDNPVARRAITIPAVVLSFLITTGLAPLLLAVALIVDVSRSLVTKRPWMATRGLVFLWLYLLGQIWALLALLFTMPLPAETKQRITFELQGAWSSWNVAALSNIFSIAFRVEGQEAARKGPFVLLSRHASIVDTLLPAHLVANPFHIRLRYVIKKELLIDPTLDIAGNRLPNHFIDRSGTEAAAEKEALQLLATDLGTDEGVLIYPEGTRFSVRKRDLLVGRMASAGGRLADIATGFRMVLPPRPGGTLALLDATDADVVVLAHHGLEGLATVREIWNGTLVDKTVTTHLWRIPRNTIPTGRKARLEWLFRVWALVDDWIVATSEAA